MNKTSETLNELTASLCKAQAEFSAVPKSSDNSFFKSKYADLATVVATAAPVLAKNGLAVTQLIDHDSETDTLTTVLFHESGQYLSSTMRLHLVKNDPQGQGSAITYARRYAYMATLGLVADVDDDGNRASQQKADEKLPPKNAVRKAPAKRPEADPETGEITGENMQPFMLSEIKDKDGRTAFFAEMTKRNIRLNAVPKDKMAEVETLIGEWAAGRPFE